MLARLHARWAREEEARIAEMNRKTVKFYTIQTTNEDPPSLFKDDEIDFDNCNLNEVIKFLQKLANSPDASKLNIAFTKHITDEISISLKQDVVNSHSNIHHTHIKS